MYMYNYMYIHIYIYTYIIYSPRILRELQIYNMIELQTIHTRIKILIILDVEGFEVHLQTIAVVCKMYRGYQVFLGTGFMHMCVPIFLFPKGMRTQIFTPRSHRPTWWTWPF